MSDYTQTNLKKHSAGSANLFADLHKYASGISNPEDKELLKYFEKLLGHTGPTYSATVSSPSENFLKKGPILKISNRDAFAHDGGLYCVDKNGLVVELVNYIGHDNNFETIVERASEEFDNNDDLIGCVVICGGKKIFALNGDERADWSDNPLSDSDSKLQATLSFECLSRFYGVEEGAPRSDVIKVAKRLASGEIELIDFQGEESKCLTTAQCKAIDEWENEGKSGKPNLTPPAPGFSLVGRRWHRAATVLLYDKKNKFSILIGQDENTYFGVELADNPRSVEAAFKSLIPKAIRDKDFKRQGEWFAVRVKQSEVPKIEDCIAEIENDVAWLGRDSDQSARHYIHSSEIRIGKDGKIYANQPSLSHENGDHVDLNCGTGWFTFYRNTAIRAYSVKGVD